MLHDPHAARHFALIGALSTGCCCAKLGAAGKAHNHDSAAGRLLMLMEVAFCGLFLSPRRQPARLGRRTSCSGASSVFTVTA